MSLRGLALTALGEIEAAVRALDEAQMQDALGCIARAGRIVVAGCGREGLQMRGLAMRLHHLGLAVGYQGEMTAPPLGPGDLLIASAGPGELATIRALMERARDAGADVLFLTGEPGTPSAGLATHVLHLPAQTMASDMHGRSALPMGSVYEGALFVACEALVLGLCDRLGLSFADMRARHTNME